MDLSIIIVSWNVKELLRENLKSLYEKSANVQFEVFVVDNNSHDGSAEMVRKEFPEVNLISNKENLGFAKANNQAIEKAQGRYVLLLNPDMRVHETTLAGMVRWMDNHKEAGVAGCHLIDEEGSTVPHVRRFPTVFDQSLIILKIPHALPFLLNRYLMKSFDYERQAVVDSIRGSFFMIRKEVIEKIGGLDEDYFIWFEEVDYCKKVFNSGWKVMYTPSVQCTDYIGKSFAQVMGYKKQHMFTQSMVTYFSKWHPGLSTFIIKFLRPFGLLLAKIVDISKDLGHWVDNKLFKKKKVDKKV